MCRSKCEAPVVQLIEHLSHTLKEPGSNHAKGNIIFFRFSETLMHTKHIGTIQIYKGALKVRNVNMVKRKNIVMDDNENNDEVNDGK